MTEREFALYEALKILMAQLVESGVVDRAAARRRLEARQQVFREHGMTNAAAIFGTLLMAVELPENKDSLPPMVHPLDDVTFAQN